MSERLQAVIFDWYGTLAAPLPADWWPKVPELITEAGGRIPEGAIEDWARAPIVHIEHSASATNYEDWSQSRLETLLGACGIEAGGRAELVRVIEEARRRELVSLVEGCVATIEELHRRQLRVALCSNWDWDLDRQLVANDLVQHFDAIICSARVGYRKPHGEIFRLVLDALEASPSQALFVGDDWEADIEGATAAGITAVHASWAVPCLQRSHAAVMCCSSLAAFLGLEELGGDATLATARSLRTDRASR